MTDPTETQVRELAEAMATALFTNGAGALVNQLVLTNDDKGRRVFDLGGWCRKSVVDQLASLLRGSALARQAAGATWTEVTDDPATWPPEDADILLVEYLRDGRWDAQPHRRHELREYRSWCRTRHLIHGAPTRWMPWPAAAQGASDGR